jgi:hypothetical protein
MAIAKWFLAKPRAIALPMPDVAPVTSTVAGSCAAFATVLLDIYVSRSLTALLL